MLPLVHPSAEFRQEGLLVQIGGTAPEEVEDAKAHRVALVVSIVYNACSLAVALPVVALVSLFLLTAGPT